MANTGYHGKNNVVKIDFEGGTPATIEGTANWNVELTATEEDITALGATFYTERVAGFISGTFSMTGFMQTTGPTIDLDPANAATAPSIGGSVDVEIELATQAFTTADKLTFTGVLTASSMSGGSQGPVTFDFSGVTSGAVTYTAGS